MKISRSKNRNNILGRSARTLGFTILEVSIVLIILAVIIGAVSSGGDLMRHAAGQRIFATFISEWRRAFLSYTDQMHAVPGDSPVSPTGMIGGAEGKALCNTLGGPALTNTMLAQGISVPAGRGAGMEDRYVYQDSNGAPHELQVCFQTVQWSVAGTSSGSFVAVQRHVMHLSGMTVELALQMDAMVDGSADARFGDFRQTTQASSTSAVGAEWPAVRTAIGDDAIAEVEAYLVLN